MANSKQERRYVALSTLGLNWYVMNMGEAGESRQQLEERTRRDIAGEAGDKPKTAEQEAMARNLQVLSYSAAMRAYPAALRHWQYMVDAGIVR